jgi:hypothetical protein
MLIKFIDGVGVEISEEELRSENPNTCFPVTLTDSNVSHLGYRMVDTSSAPSFNPLVERLVVESIVELEDESEVVTFGVSALPAEDSAVKKLQYQEQCTLAVQAMLDAEAQTRNYDGIMSLCTYATSTNVTFVAEGQAGVNWRDAVWATCYQILSDVEAGNRNVPTIDELLAELPTISWPT